MKKIIKNPIFTFILGALIFGGIVGVSAYTILANDIGYTPKDSTWKKSNGEDITNVKDAIDELYSKTKNNSNNEIGMWLAYNNVIGESMIRLQNGSIINKVVNNTSNGLVGSKFRIVELSNASGIELYAVQSGKFKVLYGDINGNSNSIEIEKEAGELIGSYSSITYGIIEALF